MPGALRRLWDGWKKVALKIANFQARLLLGLFYFTIVCPFALAVRWGSDPLAIKRGTPRGWLARPEDHESPWERAGRQF